MCKQPLGVSGHTPSGHSNHWEEGGVRHLVAIATIGRKGESVVIHLVATATIGRRGGVSGHTPSGHSNHWEEGGVSGHTPSGHSNHCEEGGSQWSDPVAIVSKSFHWFFLAQSSLKIIIYIMLLLE